MRYLIAALLLILVPTYAVANGYEVYPSPIAWSPDSRLLAAVMLNDFDGYTHSGDLVIYDRYNRVVHEFGGGFSSPSFSPDGDQLAMVYRGELWVVPVGDWADIEVVRDEGILDCRWISDGSGGSALLYSQGSRFGDADIYAIAGSFDETAIMTETGDIAAATGPAGSPSGAYIAYMRCPGDVDLFGYERVWLFDGYTGESKKVAPEQSRYWDYHESNPVFIGDNELIFQRGGWGDWRLYRRDLETGAEYIEITDAQQPSVSRDGRYLAFARRSAEEKLDSEYDWEIAPTVWIYDRERRVGRQVSAADVPAQHPALSPDGRKLAWLEGEDNQLKLQMRGIIGLFK